MHELNILLEVVDQVEALACESKIEQVKAIVLEIGELSTVVPIFMEEYYPLMVKNRPALQDSELIIESIPGLAKCEGCGEQYNVVEHDGYCPACSEFKKEVLQGREFIIKEIWVDNPMVQPEAKN
jgi:Zn finger protein HypA/HybF (possibly regulating hydrogenase expression)